MSSNRENDELTEEERQLFRDSVADIIPTHAKKYALSTRSKDQAETQDYHLSEFESEKVVSSDAYISYKHASVNAKIFSDLKMGKIPVQSQLDLHRLIIDQAQDAIQKFMQEAQQKKLRCVRIIHGKGHKTSDHPILKNKVNNWLRQLHCVLAFCSATPQDGGTGAVYILLRR